jgi:hypothetical protein
MRRRNKDGYRFDDYLDGVAQDGEHVHVPVALCDGKRSRYGVFTDAQLTVRQQARDGYIDTITEAWRGSGSSAVTPCDRSLSAADARAGATAARDAMVERLGSAWRTPPAQSGAEHHLSRDAAQPDMGTRPDEPDRERIYAERKAALSNAWRTPGKPPQDLDVGPGVKSFVEKVGRADPGNAGRIERQGEAWRAGA